MRISVFLSQLKSVCTQRGMEFSEVVKIVAEAGVKGVDVDQWAVPATIQELPLLKKHGICVNSLIARADFFHAPDPLFVDKLIADCKALKTDNILLVPGLWQEGDDHKMCMEQSLEPLRHATLKAKENGIFIGLEDYTPTESVGSVDELLFYLKNIPELHVIFDTGNFLYCGEDAFDAYKILKPYIKHQVHLKDRSFAGRESETPTIIDGEQVYSAAVGKGFLPIKEILDDLKASGFEGSITAELFGTKDSLTDILTSVEWMKQYS